MGKILGALNLLALAVPVVSEGGPCRLGAGRVEWWCMFCCRPVFWSRPSRRAAPVFPVLDYLTYSKPWWRDMPTVRSSGNGAARFGPLCTGRIPATRWSSVAGSVSCALGSRSAWAERDIDDGTG